MDRTLCMDCEVETTCRNGIGEYYMLKPHIWDLAFADPNKPRMFHAISFFCWPEQSFWDGMLCIGCVENRIGRQLVPNDFAEVPLNYRDEEEYEGFFRSERLKQRLGYI